MSYFNSSGVSKISNDKFQMWIEDGVFHIVVLTDSFTLDMAKECVRERMRITRGKPYPMLSDSRNVVDFEKGARKYLAHNDQVTNLNAGAILIKNRLQKLLGSFFLFINKPGVPARLFTDREEALAWLAEFKQ